MFYGGNYVLSCHKLSRFIVSLISITRQNVKLDRTDSVTRRKVLSYLEWKASGVSISVSIPFPIKKQTNKRRE